MRHLLISGPGPTRVRGVFVGVALAVPGGMAQAQAPEAEAFYIENVEPIIQSECIVCHSDNGVARGSGLVYSDSPSANHAALVSYINSPTLGAGGEVFLSSSIGGAAHGGGVILTEGSPDYQTLEEYVALVSTEATPEPVTVFRASLEEPLNGQVHTGVGNLRGWAVASDGILKVEVLIDGAYAFDAPYGGSRGDVGNAFPDVENSASSGFSLAFNYSDLATGPHTVTIVAQTQLGETLERTSTFDVVKFNSNFIVGDDAVSLDDAACSMAGDEITVSDGRVDGGIFDFVMKWRTAEQGFEIIEVR